jgi:hypothetical protein
MTAISNLSRTSTSRPSIRLIVALALLFSPLATLQAKIYSWKDKDGKVHYSDKAIKNAGQATITFKKFTSSWQQYKIKITDTDNALSDEEKLRIQQDVNWVYQFYNQKMFFDMHKTIPISIRLFKTEENYIRYLATLDYSGKNTRGVYFPLRNEVFVYINQNKRELTFNTIKHEVSHAILRNTTPFVPAWLNEGMAENMEFLIRKDSQFFQFAHRENHRIFQRDIAKHINVNLKEFLRLKSTDFRSQNKERGNSNQAIAGELVRMLLSSSTGRSFLGRIVHKYKRGDRTFTTYLVDKHYTGGLVVLQNNWNRWAQRQHSKKFAL